MHYLGSLELIPTIKLTLNNVISILLIDVLEIRSKMILNYRVIVEKYPCLNGVVGSLIPTVKSSLYLTGQKQNKKQKQKVGSQESTHLKVGNKLHPTPRGFLSRVGPTGLTSRRIAQR